MAVARGGAAQAGRSLLATQRNGCAGDDCASRGTPLLLPGYCLYGVVVVNSGVRVASMRL